MPFAVGECYIYEDRIFRIIFIEDEEEVIVTEVEDTESSELFFAYEKFVEDVRLENIKFVSEPCQQILVADEYFNEKQLQRRDKRWLLIQPLIYDENGNFRPEILDPKHRGKLVSARAEETKTSKDTLYSSIRLFLKRGMIKNALIPLGFERIGNKGQQRTYRRRPGRPTNLARSDGREDKRPILTDKDIKRMRQGYKKHYVDNSETSLKSAYEYTLDDHFSNVEIVDGIRKIERYPEDQLPTFGQFEYWCHQQRDLRANSREGRNKRNRRTGKGVGPPNLTERGFGPGSEVMGDWTHGHRLRSSYNPSIDIGRAIIFFLVCVFSRMVVGFHVSFKEDWESIMLGVENMAMDKEQFGDQFGKTVPKHLWPSAFIPNRIFYDGGKLDQHNTSGIVAMGVDAQTGIPYTPELRGIIEVLNRKIKRRISEYLGKTNKKAFDDEDPEALVDRRTYIRIIIEVILEYNQEPIRGYPLTQDMRQKEVPPVPVKVWEYGLSNRSRPRQIELNTVRLNLLPRARAKVYRTHIEYKGIKYEYQTNHEEKEMFHNKSLLKKERYYWIQVKYHPGLVDYIYLYEGRELIGVCELAGDDREFLGCSWREVEEQGKHDKLVTDRYQRARDASQARANTRGRIDADVARSTEEVRQAQRKQLGKGTTANGREHRAAEVVALTKSAAARPEDVGAIRPMDQALPTDPVQHPDVDVTMPDALSSAHQRRISPRMEQLLRANRPKRRRG